MLLQGSPVEQLVMLGQSYNFTSSASCSGDKELMLTILRVFLFAEADYLSKEISTRSGKVYIAPVA